MKEETCLQYRYLTNEYRIYTCKNGRKYKVYKNGEVRSCYFELTDKVGRNRCYEEKQCTPTLSSTGYFEIYLGGRKGELWLLHRLVAEVWLDKPDYKTIIEHINHNKGDNCVENIRWLTQKEYTEKYVNCLNTKKNVQIFGGRNETGN